MDVTIAKKVVRELVKAGGGYEAAADWMDMSHSYLHNLQNSTKEDDPRAKPLAWWLKLEEFAGRPLFREALATDAGCVLIPADSQHDADFRGSLLDAAAAFGKLTSDSAQAIADGRIDAAEHKSLTEDLSHASAKLHDFGKAVQAAKNAK